MKFTEFCIRRPVFTMVLSLIIVVLGIIGFIHIPVRGLPDINPPIITVLTTYPGASARIVESQITTPIENDLVGMSGLESMHSSSRQGASQVTLQFNLGENINVAVNNVRDALATISKELPTGTDMPIIQKRDPNSVQTVVLALSDPNLSAMQITDYANRYVVPQLEQVMGVASVELYNARDYAMKILLNPTKMAARSVTVNDLTQVLTGQNVDVPSGQIKSKNRYYSVMSQGELSSAQQFRHLIIRDEGGYLLRFGDVAKIKVGTENTDSAMRLHGRETVGIGVYSDSAANPIQVAQQVQTALQALSSQFPEGMKLQVAWNSTDYLKDSMNTVYHDLFIALGLVVLVALFFLSSLRATLIPFITIPICLIGVFALIYFMGYSINLFTLLALVLAIGLVVDDAIVMLENIYRHIEQGLSPFAAAIKGSSEIGFAIIAMTITLAAVYAPIGFASGMTGIVFRQFAFTLALAVILSGFVALTLSPMMCARMLRLPSHASDVEQWYYRWWDRTFSLLIAGYRRLLQWCLYHRRYVVLMLFAFVGVGYYCFISLPTELAPSEDMGAFFVKIIPPTNASFSYVNNYSKKIETMIQKIPGVQSVMSMVDPDQGGFAFVNLQPLSQRHESAQQIMKIVMKQSHDIPGAKVLTFNLGSIGGGGRNGDAVAMIISTDQSYQVLNEVVQNFIDKTSHFSGIASADQELQMNDKQYVVHVNKDMAAALNVKVANVTNALQTMLGGATVTRFNWHSQNYDVILQVPQKYLKTLQIINRLYVRSESGKMIPLSSLAHISQTVGPQQLAHDDRMRADGVYFQLTPGEPMGDVIHYLQTTAQQVLPSGVQFHFKGAAERMQESNHTMLGTFLLALVFIYLVLAAQFESFLDPFIIMLSVPLSIVGALMMLKFTGNAMSIYTGIGFVTLVGLIAKHGILITEFANQKRRQGEALIPAVMDAAVLRLRPILMTTAAMSMGALPLVLAHGSGELSRHQIGWVIVGGLLFGTFFSLIIVPVAYSFFGKFKKIAKPA